LFLAMLREQSAANPARMQAALAGLRKYQEAPRPPAPAPMPALAAAHGAALRDYGGAGPAVLFVPSLINPPNVLDMGERSLLRWLAGRGRRVLLLDWGWPGAARRPLSVAGHVEHLLLPLMAELGEPVDLVGYCLGGTMALAAARLGPARSVATLAAPWHFNGFPEDSRASSGSRISSTWPATDICRRSGPGQPQSSSSTRRPRRASQRSSERSPMSSTLGGLISDGTNSTAGPSPP